LTAGLPIRSMTAWVASRDTYPAGQRWWVSKADVTPDYFQTLRIPILRGRAFEPADRRGAPLVAIVCETLAGWFWPGENPLGRYVAVASPDSTLPPTWLEIVGVAKEVQPPTTTGASNPYLYVPLPQGHDYAMSIVARGEADEGETVRAIRQAMYSADPGVEITRSTTMDSAISAILYPRHMAAGILSFAGLVGLLLAAIGLYGVVSYSVTQRLREIGIRATLGARPSDLVRLILSEGAGVAIVGSVLGLGLGYGALQIASTMIPSVPGPAVVVFVAVPMLIAIVVLVACLLPARRAGRVDPIVVLRTI
jgi:putative ABC transport system permease protein